MRLSLVFLVVLLATEVQSGFIGDFKEKMQEKMTKTKEYLQDAANDIKEDVKGAYNDFKDFIRNFKKSYGSKAELLQRFKTFQLNIKKLSEWKKNNKDDPADYGVTPFVDMTKDEFKASHTGLIGVSDKPSANTQHFRAKRNTYPDNFDWRDDPRNVLNPIRNQGICGSCYAFSTVTTIEAAYAIHKGIQVELSEQQLVDCSFSQTNNKQCNGGNFFSSIGYLSYAGGLTHRNSYPYNSGDDGQPKPCGAGGKPIAATVNSSIFIQGDEETLKQAIVDHGPAYVAIDSTQGNLQFYKGGIIIGNPGVTWKPDHAVVVVGYGIARITRNGQDEDLPYWTIRNSWGEQWGEKGYFRLQRGNDVLKITLNMGVPVLNP